MQDSTQAMLVALVAVLIGLFLSQLGSASVLMRLVGTMFIMGAFIIGITAFLLFMKEWIVRYGN